MNLLKFVDKYSAEEQHATTGTVENSRRTAFRKMGGIARDLAMLGLPIAAAVTAPTRVHAQTTGRSADVLNFALTLEYLEAEYYMMGLDSNGLLTGDTRSIVEQISKHEDQHVEFLKSAINSIGGTPVDKPTFDFTAGGALPNVFSDAPTFLALAQAFEDTGVRAYKGQAGNLITTPDLLTAALQIHSVEARHASRIRRLRGSKGWIEGDNNSTGVAAADPVYAGEDNVTQLGVAVATTTDVDTQGITEGWDEPLDTQAVLDIAGLFIV